MITCNILIIISTVNTLFRTEQVYVIKIPTINRQVYLLQNFLFIQLLVYLQVTLSNGK
jgi:hypothetical protein